MWHNPAHAVRKNNRVLGGDIILAIQGVSLAEPHAQDRIDKIYRSFKDGDRMAVTVLRACEILKLNNYYFPDLLLPGAPQPTRE